MARSTGLNCPSLSSCEEQHHHWSHAFARPLSSSAVAFNSVTHGGGLVDSLPGRGRQGSPSSFQQWFIYIFFVLSAIHGAPVLVSADMVKTSDALVFSPSLFRIYSFVKFPSNSAKKSCPGDTNQWQMRDLERFKTATVTLAGTGPSPTTTLVL